jgi:uncharacterized protein
VTIRAVPGGVHLTVHVQPGAKSSALAGQHGDAIKVRLAAPPVDGRANEALLAFVGEIAGVPPYAVTLLRGHQARRKVVRVEGVSVATATALFLPGG